MSLLLSVSCPAYEGGHVVLTAFCPACFTWHEARRVHPRGHKWPSVVFSYGRVTLHRAWGPGFSVRSPVEAQLTWAVP